MEIVFAMSNRRNINKVRSEGGFFKYGVQYDDKSTESIGYAKPDPKAMSANHGSYGQPVPNPKNIRKITDIIREQKEREELELKREKTNALIDKLLSLRGIKNIVPTKIKTIFTNLPVITPKNIYKYLRAEVSNIEQGPVSLPVYEERKKICGECPHRMFPDGYHDPLGFCTKCGCGANPRAQLTVKLKLPATSCPLDKWGESTGIYEGLWGRIRYIFTRRRSK
jgi:hypothetical protein